MLPGCQPFTNCLILGRNQLLESDIDIDVGIFEAIGVVACTSLAAATASITLWPPSVNFCVPMKNHIYLFEYF